DGVRAGSRRYAANVSRELRAQPRILAVVDLVSLLRPVGDDPVRPLPEVQEIDHHPSGKFALNGEMHHGNCRSSPRIFSEVGGVAAIGARGIKIAKKVLVAQREALIPVKGRSVTVQ